MSSRKRPASEPQPPPAKKSKVTIKPETAADEDKFKLIRSLDLSLLKPETIARLNTHNFDSLQKDPQAKVVVRSGSTSGKCELVRSTDQIRPFKIIAKADIKKGECVAVYMGRLIEAERFTEQNIWQYEIPAKLFPPKRAIPTLVLDASKSANECRFIHAEEWYKGKTANVDHSIVWDIHQHVPQIIYRAKRNISAGEDLLMTWGVTGVKYKEEFDKNKTANNKEPDPRQKVPIVQSNNINKNSKEAQREPEVPKIAITAVQSNNNNKSKARLEPEIRQKVQLSNNTKNGKEIQRESEVQQKAPIQSSNNTREASRLAREQEIIRTKEILVQAKKIQENHEQIKRILAEKKTQDLNKPARTINYGTTKVTKKSKSIGSDLIENNGEDQPLEAEELRPAPNGHHRKPVVEIDFFSSKVQTVANPRDSISSSANYMPDVTFDLNDSLALSEEEEELETFVI